MVGAASLDCPSSSTVPVPLLWITPKPVGQQLPHWLVPQVYVLKRPHVDEFLQRMGKLFECVLFTASLAKYALCWTNGEPSVPGCFESRVSSTGGTKGPEQAGASAHSRQLTHLLCLPSRQCRTSGLVV